jgi:hypothetical protein
MSTPQSVRTDVGYVTELPGGVGVNSGADAAIPSNTTLYTATNAAANVTVTLPDARTNNGQTLFVNADASGAAGDIIITPAGTDTLTGGDITVASTANETYLLVAAGTTWTPLQIA